MFSTSACKSLCVSVFGATLGCRVIFGVFAPLVNISKWGSLFPPPSRWVPPSLPPPPLPGAAPRASRRRAPPRIVRPGLANGGREAAVPRADCRGANPRPGADRRRRAGGGGGGPRVRCPAPRVRGPARRVSAERALPAPVPRPLGGGVAVLRPRGQRCWFIYFPRGPVFSGRGAVGDAGGAGPAGRGKAVPGALPGAPR